MLLYSLGRIIKGGWNPLILGWLLAYPLPLYNSKYTGCEITMEVCAVPHITVIIGAPIYWGVVSYAV
jgi:hypothetical protein